MAKANPKAWFPNGYMARMSYKSVGKHERAWSNTRPYFDTWAEAHGWMLAVAEKRLKRAQADLKSATRYHAKVKAMSEPLGLQMSEVDDA